MLDCINQSKRFSYLHKYDVIKNYGAVKVIREQSDWIREIPELELSEKVAKISGVLQACYLIVRFVKYQTYSELMKVLAIFQSDNAHLVSNLFSHLGINVPINIENSINSQIERIKSLTDDEIKDLCFMKKIKILNRDLKTQQINLDSWKELVDISPDWTIRVWGEDILGRKENTKDLLYSLIEKIIKLPRIIRKYPSLWEPLLKEAPEHEIALRNAFLIFCKGAIAEQQLSPRFSFRTFKLNLPSEVSLLPHLVNALLNNYHTNYYELRDDRKFTFFSKQIEKMVDDALSLREIIYDLSQPCDIRAAGMIAFLLHPNGSKDLGCVKQLLVEFYNSTAGHWYIKTVAACLCLLATEEDPNAKWIVNSLLEATRADYEARQCLHGLLHIWRESSHSPIQKAGVLDKWLSGTE